MTIEWLAGNRIRGTTAERPNFGLPSGSVGGWVEVGRTTLGSDTATVDVSSIPDKRYYMVLMDYTQTTDFSALHRLGNSSIDTGNNYNNRQSTDGGSDSTGQATWVRVDNGWQSGDRKLAVEYIANKSNKEKLIMNHMVRSVTTGASQAPQRSEVVSKWVNTSNVLDKFQMMNVSSGDFASGSECVVLGWDPADTHTSNFWEELASVNGDGTGGFDTGTFTSKKYLWVQAYLDPSTSARNNFRVGNSTVDTGTNYTNRGSTDGGADSTETSVTIVRGNATSYSTPSFFNMFIINNSANEKLVIGHTVIQNTAGAATTPNRIEFVSKWADTSNQIDIIEAFPSSGNYSTTSQIKVWGSD